MKGFKKSLLKRIKTSKIRRNSKNEALVNIRRLMHLRRLLFLNNFEPLIPSRDIITVALKNPVLCCGNGKSRFIGLKTVSESA
jgi:hypothetical protein